MFTLSIPPLGSISNTTELSRLYYQKKNFKTFLILIFKINILAKLLNNLILIIVIIKNNEINNNNNNRLNKKYLNLVNI